jgi:hypothetical protein
VIVARRLRDRAEKGMALFRLTADAVERLEETSFVSERLSERADMHRLFKQGVAEASDSLMVIAEEFADWRDSDRRIDFLCIDRSAKLIVVELKRSNGGGHMELQALRYAAMVSGMSFGRLVDAYSRYSSKRRTAAEETILDFLGWPDASANEFPNGVGVILMSNGFSAEVASTIHWLGDYDIDIQCLKATPYRLGEEIIVDLQPLRPATAAGIAGRRIGGRPRRLNGQPSTRRMIRLRFWQRMLALPEMATSAHAVCAATIQSWLQAPAGAPGLLFNHVIEEEEVRVELYLDLGRGCEGETQALYERLKADRPAIERRFGEALVWDDWPDRRARRIGLPLPGGIKAPESEWPAVQRRMIEAMNRLQQALGPSIEALGC